jgi:tryptophan synthase alpha subunit
MRNENIVEAIESQLADAIELGMSTEEALADAAGLITDAEVRFIRLSHPGFSLPPPPRA